METWNDMTKRHIREKVEAIESLGHLTQVEAAAKLDMHVSTLQSYIRQNGVSWTNKKVRMGLSVGEVARRIGMARKGLSTRQIADELGLEPCSVHNWFKRNGLELSK